MYPNKAITIAQPEGCMLAAALRYAARGWAVFPIYEPSVDLEGRVTGCSCGYRNAKVCSADTPKQWGKHPRTAHGLKDASKDEQQIRAWWTQWPNANIGIATGEPSKLYVVDVDGEAAATALAAALPKLSATLKANTGKGWHLYFQHSGSWEGLSITQNGLGLHVDTRGAGGYVVAPPSLHTSGKRYAWQDENMPAAALPVAAVLAAVKAGKAAASAARKGKSKLLGAGPEVSAKPEPTDWIQVVQDAENGTLNDVLNRAACALANKHMREGRTVEYASDAVWNEIKAARERRCTRDADAYKPNAKAEKRVRDAVADMYAERAKRPYVIIGYEETFDDQKLHARVLEQLQASRGDKLFTFGQRLSALDPDRATVTPLAPELIHMHITGAMQLARLNDEGEEKPCNPPALLTKQLSLLPSHAPIRELKGIVRVPIMRSETDASILQDPGYDPATKLYYCPSNTYPRVPDAPTHEEAQAAARYIWQFCDEFPYAPHEGHDREALGLSGVLSATLTPLVRHFCGPAPMHIVTAPNRGAGKGKLVMLASTIGTGTAVAAQQLPRGDELAKMITATIMAGTRAVCFDNIKHDVEGAALEGLITGHTWSGRVLGLSRMVDLDNHLTIYGTANNPNLSADMARRCLEIRLAPDGPRTKPYRFADLETAVRAHQPSLTACALTILRAYACSPGTVRPVLPSFGSFEKWSTIVRGAIVWLGLPDPLLLKPDADDHGDAVEAAPALRALAEYGGTFTARQLAEWSSRGAEPEVVTKAVRGACCGLFKVDGTGAVDPRVVGRWLRNHLDVLTECGGEYKLVRAPMLDGNRRWRVEIVKLAPPKELPANAGVSP